MSGLGCIHEKSEKWVGARCHVLFPLNYIFWNVASDNITLIGNLVLISPGNRWVKSYHCLFCLQRKPESFHCKYELMAIQTLPFLPQYMCRHERQILWESLTYAVVLAACGKHQSWNGFQWLYTALKMKLLMIPTTIPMVNMNIQFLTM